MMSSGSNTCKFCFIINNYRYINRYNNSLIQPSICFQSHASPALRVTGVTTTCLDCLGVRGEVKVQVKEQVPISHAVILDLSVSRVCEYLDCGWVPGENHSSQDWTCLIQNATMFSSTARAHVLHCTSANFTFLFTRTNSSANGPSFSYS